MLKNRKAIIIILALSLILLFTSVACNNSASSGTVLKVGVDDTYPPMEYKDDKNVTVGFDVDFAKEIGKRLNKTVEFVSNAWDGIFQALKTNKFDCIISSVSLTDDRLKEFAFTKPYIANAQVIVVKPSDNTITEGKDLKDKNVGCQVSTTANDSCKKLLETVSFNLKTYDQVLMPFADMKAGRLDAIVVDEVVADYYVATDPQSFKVASGKLTNEPIGICFKKGNEALRDKVQKAIDDMTADGTLKNISVKWFGVDLTSNIDQKLWQ